jgi:hypothetical protein
MTADKDYIDVDVVVPHETVAKVECCGCLVAVRSGENAEIRCNECDALIDTVPNQFSCLHLLPASSSGRYPAKKAAYRSHHPNIPGEI